MSTAQSAGVGLIAIIQAILSHAGDIQAIIAAILALIPHSPTPPVTPPLTPPA